MNDRPKKQLTLAVLHSGTHVLLGMKKRGFGEGLWNGFGGKIRAGESVETAARREVREECGIELKECRPRGTLTFEFAGQEELLEVHVFSSADFRGQPAETDEMRPQWYRFVDVPYGKMRADDRHWLPRVLAGENVQGRFYFLDQDTLLHYDLHVSTEISPTTPKEAHAL